jgi:hypothetical protein
MESCNPVFVWKTSDWSDCFKIRGHEMMFISRFGHYSWRRSGENNPLESRGVRVLTKCSRKQIGVVATQTILKVDKRPGKHISLQQRIREEQ